MIDLVIKFFKHGYLVLDFYCDTLSTVKACLMLPNHRRLIGCKMETECDKQSEPYLVETCALQLLETQSDLTGCKKLFSAAKTFLTTRDAKNANRTKNHWPTPPGIHPFQTFPDYLPHCMGTIYHDCTIFRRCKDIPMSEWTRKYVSMIPSLDSKAIMA